MANSNFKKFATGKVVYFVGGQKFLNSGKGKHDGMDKAKQFCLDNFYDINNIIKFDSETECDYYIFLLNRMKNGEISNLSHHFLFRVQEEFVNANGDKIPEITYCADFVYKDEITGKRVVVDVKSSPYFIDDRFIFLKSIFDKQKLERDLYIQIIMRKGKDDWYEWHIGEKKKSQKLIKKQREEIKDYKTQLHKIEIENKKAEREKALLLKYRELYSLGKITKVQLKRLRELEEKYKI